MKKAVSCAVILAVLASPAMARQKKGPAAYGFEAGKSFGEGFTRPEADFSTPPVSESDMEIARKAVNAAEAGDWREAKEQASRAADPVVLKIVKWMEYTRSDSGSSEEIKDFLENAPNWPLQDALKAKIGEFSGDSGNSESGGWKKYADKIRTLIKERSFQKAYQLSKEQYARLQGQDRADALFLSGWLALRFMNKPMEALYYFDMLYRVSKMPVSLARGAYWSGRAAEKAGNANKAMQWYRIGAQHNTTFYGQLAALKLNRGFTLRLPPSPILPGEKLSYYLRDERIKAARVMDSIKKDRLARLFITRFLNEARSPSDYMFVARLGQKTLNYSWAVLAGKKAAQNFITIPDANYPVLKFTPEEGPEKALVMAITRQESELDSGIVSPAGAVGMMQLMPQTAQRVASRMGVQFDESLLYDKNYNMKIASFHLKELIEDFGGSYIMAVAAYNAGPGNVRKWLGTYGDPRGKTLEQIVDWIEMIPFYETRNYVQRVMEAVQVYRARLRDSSHELMLTRDLNR